MDKAEPAGLSILIEVSYLPGITRILTYTRKNSRVFLPTPEKTRIITT